MFRAAQKRTKVSHYVAEQIRTAVLTGEFKPGDRLGSEKELTDQFQVSKASMREAIRVLEVMGLVEIRKGLVGGIFAAEADMNATINSLTNFLHFKNTSFRDLTMFRYLIEPAIAQIAALKADDDDIQKLNDMTDRDVAAEQQQDPNKGIGFHRDIARFSENPLIILLLDFMECMMVDIKAKLCPGPDFYREVARDHYRILECFRKKDGDGARKEMAKHVLCVGDHLAGLEGVTPFNPAEIDSARAHETNALGPLLQPNVLELLGSLNNQRCASSSAFLKHVATGKLFVFESNTSAEALDAEETLTRKES